MLTPTKGIAPDRALLAVGAQILLTLDQPATVSQAWSRFVDQRTQLGHRSPVTFEWFALGLDVLYALGLVEIRDDVLISARSGHAASPLG